MKYQIDRFSETEKLKAQAIELRQKISSEQNIDLLPALKHALKLVNFKGSRNEIVSKAETIANEIKSLESEKTGQFDARLPELKQDLVLLNDRAKRFDLVLQVAENYNVTTFLSAANPMNSYKLYSHLNSAREALKANKIKLLEIDKALVSGAANKWLEAMINDMLKKTSVENIEPENIQFMANEIFQDNKILSTPEITLVFRRIITGKYGKLYNRANALNVLPCFAEYRAEREKAFQAIEQEKHNSSNMYDVLNHFSKSVAKMPNDSNIKKMINKQKFQTGRLFDQPKIKEVYELEIKMKALLEKMQSVSSDEINELQIEYMQLGDRILELENPKNEQKNHK